MVFFFPSMFCEKCGIAAGGQDGTVQYNLGGQLAGRTNYFIHAETGRLAVRPEAGSLLRFYNDGVIGEDSLVFALRQFANTAEIVMGQEGEETLRLRGDGSIQAAGRLSVGSLSVGGADGASWYIPEQGDLSMGQFTQE